MMKTMRMAAAAAAAAACAAGVAQAQVYYEAQPGEPVIVLEPRVPDGSPAHRGGLTLDDQALADQVSYAIPGRRPMQSGLATTVVATNGNVTISGSAESFEQAQRAEIAAKHAAGAAHVGGMISTTSG
jgi:osmotically-inducible protein OsmY